MRANYGTDPIEAFCFRHGLILQTVPIPTSHMTQLFLRRRGGGPYVVRSLDLEALTYRQTVDALKDMYAKLVKLEAAE